jgi:hypothetical protein
MSKADFERESLTCTLLWLINCGGKEKTEELKKEVGRGGT